MHNFFEQYGRMILLAFIASISIGILAFYTINEESPISDGTDAMYERETERTNEDLTIVQHPVIELAYKKWNNVWGNIPGCIHLFAREVPTHDFKSDIILTDNGQTLDCSSVNFRMMSTAYNTANPQPGYYEIKYWYTSPTTNFTTTYLATVVIH